MLAPFLVDLDAGAGAERVEGLVGQEAVVGDRLDREVHAVAGGIGLAPVDQLADQLDHAVDVLGGMGLAGRAPHPEAVHGFPPLTLVLVGHLGSAAALGIGPVR